MIRPWLQLHTRDVLDCKELARCKPDERFVLMALMCLAHEGTPYGHLADDIGALTDDYMAARCVVPVALFRRAVASLIQNTRLRKTDDGILFVPRMVRDEDIRQRRSEGGWKSQGNQEANNPLFHSPGFVYLVRRSSDGAIKIGAALNPKKRLYKLSSNIPGDDLKLLEAYPVEDMGRAESVLHTRFSTQKVIGEWFALDTQDLGSIPGILDQFTPGDDAELPRGNLQDVTGGTPHARTDTRSDSGVYDSDSSESSGENNGKPKERLPPRNPSLTTQVTDPQWFEFMAKWKKTGGVEASVRDWDEALSVWKTMDFEERLEASMGLDRDHVGKENCLPQNYLGKRIYRRGLRKTPANSRSDELRRVLEAREAQRS